MTETEVIYYWSDAIMTKDTERFMKNFFTNKIEKVKATIVAKTVKKIIDKVVHEFHYILCDGGEMFATDEISPRYIHRNWKFVLCKNPIQMELYLSYIGFKTKTELNDKKNVNKMSQGKGCLSLKRKSERYI